MAQHFVSEGRCQFCHTTAGDVEHMMSKVLAALDWIFRWFGVVAVAAFWVFGVYIGSVMLSMSTRGRIDGGVFLNAAVTVYVLVWLGGVTAFMVAIWKNRRLRAGGQQLAALARSARPADPIAAEVWPWIKAAWWAWLFVMGFILCFGSAMLLGIM